MRVLYATLTIAALVGPACSGKPTTEDETDAGSEAEADADTEAGSEADAGPDPLSCAWPLVDDGNGVCGTTSTLWSTWSGRPTSPGDDVTIPTGTRILLDVDAVVGALVVRGELSVLDRTAASLTVASIDLDGGSLRIGEPTKPFTGRLEVTFDGALARRLRVHDGGSLTIVGTSPTSTWTHLAVDAAANATVLVVDAATGVHSGDRIAITPSDFYDYDVGDGSYWSLTRGPVGPTQVATLAQVEGSTLTLADALTEPRRGTKDTVAVDVALDERAEVAFLSRNIVLASADDAHFRTNEEGLIIDHDSSGDFLLDGVEIRRAGIASVTRGYPINLYGSGGATVLRSSVSESVRGCVQLGGAGGATVRDNVCVDALGHGLFVRAGSTGNVLRGNLISHLRYPQSLPDEVHQVDGNFGGTSGIYSEEPLTDIRENTASDTEGNGFWLSFDSTVPMLPFEDNVAHSVFLHGILLARWNTDGDASYLPEVGDDPADVSFHRVAAWKNGGFGLAVQTTSVVVTDGWFADNVRTSVERFDYGASDLGRVTGNVFVRSSPNDATVVNPPRSALGHQVSGEVSGNTFIGFPAGPSARGVLSQIGISWSFSDPYLGTFGENELLESGLTWRATEPAYFRLSAPAYDPNGRVGPAGYYWVFDDPFVTDASCEPAMIGGTQNHVSCAGPYAALDDVTITSAAPSSSAIELARIDTSNPDWPTTLAGATPTHTLANESVSQNDYPVPIIANAATALYLASVPGHASLAGVSKVVVHFYVPPSVRGTAGSAILAMKTTPTDTFTVRFRWVWFMLDSANAPMASSRAALMNTPAPSDAIWFHDAATGYVYFRLYDYGYCPPGQPSCPTGTPWYWATGNGGGWELVVDVVHH